MTYITRTAASSNTPLGATSLYHLVIFAETIASGVSRKWQAYRTRQVLAALSNDQLTDIGIARGQIAAVAAQASTYR